MSKFRCSSEYCTRVKYTYQKWQQHLTVFMLNLVSSEGINARCNATHTIDINDYFRQNIGGKAVADTASGSASHTRSKPLETKRSSSGKPLQKVAPVYVKKVVAEIVTSEDQIEGTGQINILKFIDTLHIKYPPFTLRLMFFTPVSRARSPKMRSGRHGLTP